MKANKTKTSSSGARDGCKIDLGGITRNYTRPLAAGIENDEQSIRKFIQKLNRAEMLLF